MHKALRSAFLQQVPCAVPLQTPRTVNPGCNCCCSRGDEDMESLFCHKKLKGCVIAKTKAQRMQDCCLQTHQALKTGGREVGFQSRITAQQSFIKVSLDIIKMLQKLKGIKWPNIKTFPFWDYFPIGVVKVNNPPNLKTQFTKLTTEIKWSINLKHEMLGFDIQLILQFYLQNSQVSQCICSIRMRKV